MPTRKPKDKLSKSDKRMLKRMEALGEISDKEEYTLKEAEE